MRTSLGGSKVVTTQALHIWMIASTYPDKRTIHERSKVAGKINKKIEPPQN